MSRCVQGPQIADRDARPVTGAGDLPPAEVLGVVDLHRERAQRLRLGVDLHHRGVDAVDPRLHRGAVGRVAEQRVTATVDHEAVVDACVAVLATDVARQTARRLRLTPREEVRRPSATEEGPRLVAAQQRADLGEDALGVRLVAQEPGAGRPRAAPDGATSRSAAGPRW